METYYKILRNGRSCHGGDHTWAQGVTYEVDEVIPCKKGFHACRLQDLSLWLTYDMEIWEIELEEVVVDYDKVVGRTAKLTKRLGSFPADKQVEFARWCANTTAAAHAVAADAVDAVDAAAAAAARAANAAYAARAHAADRAAAARAADAAYAAAREAQGRKILELLT